MSDPELAPILERNIAALIERRLWQEQRRPWQDRLADRITQFSGSVRFVFLHLALFGSWILWNQPWSPLPKFDPTYVVLAMFASVEAIILSTFVLITQQRMSAMAEERADLDLQISLVAEHEVTRLVQMVSLIAGRLGIAEEEGLEELKKDIAPEAALDSIERSKGAIDSPDSLD